ncbi:cysteine desulfurase [Clostridia bacterium]|nr:cysteine desulfurase [Clostridia bacterium]
MIYLDNAATTAPSPDILRKTFDFAGEVYGNPNSLHAAGIAVGKAVESARTEVMNSVANGVPGYFVFTSSGTEANNLALFGAAEARGRRGGRIIITDSEHDSVYRSIKKLEEKGFDAVYLSTKGGAIDTNELKNALDDRTIIVSVMSVNNETGAIYDTASVSKILAETYSDAKTRPLFHTDAVQAFGKIPLAPADLVSISAHKIHGLKGTGGLFIREGTRILPILFGGHDEKGLRASTPNTPGIYAIGLAAKAAADNLAADNAKVSELWDYTKVRISELCPKAQFTSDCFTNPKAVSKYILSLRLPGTRSEVVLNHLSANGICISSGSACSAKSTSANESKRVLYAFGLTKEEADSTLRISFCANNTKEEADELAQTLSEAHTRFSVSL